MKHIGATLQQALQQHQAGNLPAAEELYRRVLVTSPRNADALHLLGVLEHQSGRFESATKAIHLAIAVDPRQAIFHNNLAAAYRALGRLEEAAESYRQALRLNPDYADAMSNLAAVELARGEVAAAIPLCRRALQIAPHFVEAHNNLGNALKTKGEFAEAEACYRLAIEIRPEFALAHNNLGALLEEIGRPAEARSCFEQSLRLDSQSGQTWSNYGNNLLQAGRTAEARQCFENALTLEPRDGMRIKAALTLPYIYADREELLRERGRIEAAVAELQKQPLAIADPVHDVGLTAMNIAYHGQNDRDLQQAIARLMIRATPSLEFVAPHCRRPRPVVEPGSRLKIGIISRHLHDHSNARLNAGFVRELTRPEFHVTLLRFPGRDDAMSQFVAAGADEVVTLPTQFEPSRQAIADKELDVLFYTDIGMEPLTYCLAFARLAPVQCTTWGVPDTTGIPNVDYYLSNVDLEPQDADAHYSERLVKLNALPTYYYRPRLPARSVGRERFGLDASRHLYLCPQSLFKLHPEFDLLLARILRADPEGEIGLIEGGHPHWTTLFQERLQRTLGDVAGRVRFFPQMPATDFHSLLSVADVMLDPIHFGGGNTTFEALAFGTPIVTLAGEFLRSRVTYACYRQIGVLDAVAPDLDGYVTLAVALGTNARRREDLRSRLRAASAALFENRGSIRELEDFFRQAVGTSATT